MLNAQTCATWDNVGMTHWTLNYLASVLERRDWSMNKLAKLAGVTPSTINRPLRDKDYAHGLSPRTVAKIHQASGIDPVEFMPKDMQEPGEMFRAATDSTAARALAEMDNPQKPNAQNRNEIKIAIVGDLCQIVATVDKSGIANLRRKLDAIEAMIDD